MTDYLSGRPFSVIGNRPVHGACTPSRHAWAVESRKSPTGHECWYCKVPCQVDGTDAREESK